MKKNLFTLMTLALSVSALTLVVSCGEDEKVTPTTEQNDNQNGQGAQNEQEKQNEQGNQDEGDGNQIVPTAPIVVTIDASGKADGGHNFAKIDETNFYIDDIKYTASQGDLLVSGYNAAFLKGEAKIISQLNYEGREMLVKEIAQEVFYGCTVLTSVIISEGVTSIGESAFKDCTGLTSVALPSSVTSIGVNTFRGCTELSSITVADGNPAYDSHDNCNAIIETQSNTLIAGCKNSTIPSSVTSIGEGAFAACTGLTDVYCYAETVPSSDVYSIFYYSNIANATLHVPASAIDAYKTKAPWCDFGSIVAIE